MPRVPKVKRTQWAKKGEAADHADSSSSISRERFLIFRLDSGIEPGTVLFRSMTSKELSRAQLRLKEAEAKKAAATETKSLRTAATEFVPQQIAHGVNDKASMNPNAVEFVPQQPSLSVSIDKLLSAVSELYSEEVLPTCAVLRWWLRDDKGDMPEVADVLRTAFAAQEHLEVQAISKDGNKKKDQAQAILPRARSERWLHGYRTGLPADWNVPQHITNQATSLAAEGGWLPYGYSHWREKLGKAMLVDRLVVAAWMRERASSDELRRMSLGRLGAVVFELNRQRVLRTRGGFMVPFALSEESEKERNAHYCVPTGLRAGEAWVTTWPQLLQLLRISVREHGGQMHVSCLKSYLRARFQLELSETALGHTSLRRLFDDPRISEFFDVTEGAEFLRPRSPQPVEKVSLHSYRHGAEDSDQDFREQTVRVSLADLLQAEEDQSHKAMLAAATPQRLRVDVSSPASAAKPSEHDPSKREWFSLALATAGLVLLGGLGVWSLRGGLKHRMKL
eukprot:TRINITY_DN53652_c0_g1_i1.p1 TRINITY_DN53652_c0_g1~~TRINITY_DN53652_c0_g1_i1.p1  ORF type:complete len:508 (+),score=123.91 TRINITY_DN53652_c0_g1_i1:45-1568(+)